jgi:hypothetical protein
MGTEGEQDSAKSSPAGGDAAGSALPAADKPAAPEAAAVVVDDTKKESESADGKPRAKQPPKPLKPIRSWAPRKGPVLSTRTTVLLIAAGVAMAALLLVVAVFLSDQLGLGRKPGGPPALGPVFEDPNNNYTIRPPANWRFEDPHDGKNIFIQGPKEDDFRPLIIITLDIKPGSIESYVQEHKARTSHEDKLARSAEGGRDAATTVKWLKQEEDSIDGCPHTVRLEYEYDYDVNGRTVKIRGVQFIMEDKPRFYRVSCYATEALFDRYLARFEASARTFKRTPLRVGPPQPLRD